MVLRAALDVTLNDPLLGSESAMPLLEAGRSLPCGSVQKSLRRGFANKS